MTSRVTVAALCRQWWWMPVKELQGQRWVEVRVVRIRGIDRVQVRESRVVEPSGRYLEATAEVGEEVGANVARGTS